MRENKGERVSHEHDTQRLKIDPFRILREENGTPQEPAGRFIARLALTTSQPFSSARKCNLRALSRLARETLVHSKPRKPMLFYALSALAISGATETVLTPLSRVSVASTASTPER